MAESGKRKASSLPNEDEGFAVAEERGNSFVYLQESDDESSPVKVCYLKLLIKHAKGVEMEEKDFSCRVKCSFDFQAFWNFYNQTNCGRKMLEAILEKHHCRVSLVKDKPFQGLCVFQILNQRFHEKSDVEQFVQVILDTVQKNAEQELLLSKLTVDPRLHKDVLERVRLTKELDSVWIESGSEQGHEIYMVYQLEHKLIVLQRMSDIVNAIEETFKNHEELICVDLMWQRVMIHFGYMQNVNHKFPNLMISCDESKNAIVLKGPRDEAKAAADTVLKLLETAQHEISEVTFAPECDFSIFAHPEMCAYIKSVIPKVPIYWILNVFKKKIHVFAKDPKQLQGIDKAIKGCVQEKFYPVLKDHSIFYKERARYLEELKKQHTGKLVMHSSTEGLRVTAADDIIEIVDAAIQEIISRERGADQDAHEPEKQDERDRKPFSKFAPAKTGGYQDKSGLISMKGMVTEREIKETISVANKDVFHKLVVKDLEEFKCKGKDLHVIVKEVETETKVGFELEGSTEKEVGDVLQFIKQRIELEERQLHVQKSTGDSTGATASPEEGNIAGPNATGKTENNETTDKCCVLKLLINYLKSKGEDDTFQDRVHCSFYFQAFWNFYNQTNCGRKMLEAILEKHHCRVSLVKDEPFQGLFVFQILNQRFHEKSDVEQFVQVILDTVQKNAEQELLLSKLTVDPRLHKDVLERVRLTKELDSVWIESGSEQGHEICMVYQLEHKMIVLQRMSDIVNTIEETFKNHEELICVDLMWQRVMIHFGYMQNVNHKFPNLMISCDESKNAIVLKGPRDEAKAAADTVLELLETAKCEISKMTFSPNCRLEIFTHPEMCAYINRAIPAVAVIWLLNPLTKKIHVFAKDPKQLQGIDKAIKGCVQEKFYPVLKDHSIFYKERARYLEELKKQHTGKLVMHSSTEGLWVTAADDILEIVDAAIQEIISRERGADQDAHEPKKQDERDRKPFSKSVPARTDGYQDKSGLVSMKGMVTEREIKETISVANKDVFHKLVVKDLEEFKCKGKDLHVIVKEVETETKVGFELEGSTEKEVGDVLQFIKQRIELEERQLHAQKSTGDSTGATASPEEGNIAGPNATGKTESNETTDKCCVLKLLINYLKSKGEDDTFQDRVHCSFYFQAFWNFYNQTNCGRKMLEAILEKHHCRVSLVKDEPFQGLFVFQILNQRFHEKSDVEQFVQIVLDTVQKNAEQELLLSKLTVDPRLHKDVLERVRLTKELDSVWIESGSEQGHEICMVYQLEHKMIVLQRMSDIVNAIEESFKNHEELICVDLMWQRVMIHFGYLQNVNHKFPNLMISCDESKNAIVLKGPRDEAKAAADTVLELLETAKCEISKMTFSPNCRLEIFTHPEMCAYINRAIPAVAVIWLLNPLTKKIHVFAKDPKQLQGIDKAIKGCVQEKFYPVLKDHSIFYKERARYLEELKKQHTGKLVMHSSTEGLWVTAADDILEIVDAAIQEIISRERGADQDAHEPKKPDKRDRKPFSKSVPAKTGGYQDTGGLVSMKGMVTEREIKETIAVASKEIFHKLVVKDLEEFKCKGKDLHVIVKEVETETKVGFELEGSTEKEVGDVLQFIKQRIELKEQQLHAQKGIGDSTGATASPEEGNIAGPNATGKTESNETTAKPDDPGLEQREWSYPNGKKIMLVKATSCDADVIIIPGNSDKDGQSQFGEKKLVKLKVPDGSEGKAKTDLQEEVEQVLKQILEKTVGISIKAVEGWNFHRYLKCFLYGIYKCFMRNEGKPCPIKCVILLVDDASDYNKAVKIIQISFKLEQDKSKVFAGQELLPQEQGSVFKRIRVKVQNGQLHEAQVQVLVNTVDRSLDLTKGVISSSLLGKAGKGIQKELQQYQGNIMFGEVLKTGCGTLPKPCMAIFHGVLFVYEEHSDCLKAFQDFLARCLEDANKKYRSIAFPPIGTGKLRYPKDLVASIMFQSVAKFEEAHPTSKLEDVVFVIYEKDQETLKIFEEMHRRCVDASFGKGTEQQGASLSSSETPIPTALTELKTVGGTAPSRKKTEVKEPVSPVITEADRSEVKEPVSPVIRSEEKDIAPPKVLLPGNKQLKNILQYSDEENCSFFVCDVDQEGVRSLRRQITGSSVTAKFVYPYESRNALVICQNQEEKDTIMNKVKDKYQVQCVGPQKIQGFTAVVDPVICRKARKMKKVEDLIATVEKKSGVTISCTDSSIQFKAVTSHQLEIAQECLIRFAKETLEINVQGRSTENSGNFINAEKIENVSQTEFLALKSLEIYSKWTQKFNIKFTHDKETLYAQGDLLYLNEERKKEIEKEIVALRGKQKTELLYDPEEIMQFRSAVDEAKSDELLLVWDDDNKQVLVYSDSYDVMQKFKHKVEFKMGKKKLTGRSGRRFAKQEDTMPLLSEEESPTKKKIARSFSWSQDATNVEVFKTLEGIMVKVYNANILRLDVDCIVNAANDNLQHGGGVALVIAKGAGPEIDREGSEILKIRGRINVGEQCVTTAGNLPYDCVIHTVGPRWSDYYPHDARNIARCETDLFNSIIGCFIEAENRHLKSIALPAISSGIFAVPRDVCTEQYAKAVIHYSKTRTSLVLQEIHFIDMLPGIVNDMQLAFKRHLSCDGNAKHKVNSGDQAPAINNQAGGDHGNNQHDTIPEKDIGAASPTEEKQNLAPVLPKFEETFVKEQKSHVYRPNQNMAVYIYTTDITKLTGVKAVVCSDDIRGNGYGAVASALLQIGKSTYKSVKKKAFEKEVCFGDVIVTLGGDSNFDLVIHAVVPSFKDKISPQRHRELVRICYDKILDDTNNWGKASLALPFIGTGCVELGYEGSAKLFLDSLEVFCNRATTLNLKVIHIVDKDKHTTEKIADVFSKHTDIVRRNLLATHDNVSKSARHPSSHTSSVGPQGEISQVKPKTPVSGALPKEDCHICMNKAKSPKTLSCGHTFCIKCIESKPACPKCGAFHGIIYGNQPEGGVMKVTVLQLSLKGFEKRDTLKIEYWIPSGKQGPNHPEPGKWFDSINKIAYLPDTREGRKVCDLLRVAFDRRLIFTFGRSSWGHVLTWNNIHHKTMLGGQYGYPDSGYLQRVQEQLAAKGITEADIKLETAL